MNYIKCKALYLAKKSLIKNVWNGNAYDEAEFNGYAYQGQYTYSFLRIPLEATSVWINSNAYLNACSVYATNGYTKTGRLIDPSTIIGNIPGGYNYGMTFSIPKGYEYIRILNRNRSTIFKFS